MILTRRGRVVIWTLGMAAAVLFGMWTGQFVLVPVN